MLGIYRLYLYKQKKGKKIMDKKEFEARMKAHRETFQKLMEDLTEDVIDFKESNEDVTMYVLHEETDHFCDSMIEFGGWIKDKVNGSLDKRGSLTKKLKRAIYDYN